jgi:4-amino-4-deoxy-L-arabinose transferase-like glycosyltransferase
VSRRSAVAWVLGLVALAMVLRLVFFTGFVGSDDSVYLEAGADLVQRGHWLGKDLASSRLGFVAATAGAIKLFGMNEFGTIAVSYVAALALLIEVFFLARLYFGDRAGVLAVALLALYPLNIVLSTILVPEILLGALMAGAVLAYETSRRRVAPAPKVLGAVGAGVLLGIAYLVKEPAALLIAGLGLAWAVLAIKDRRIEAAWVGVIAGFVLVMGAESLVRFATTGGAFERFRISSQTIAFGQATWQEERDLAPWYLYPRSMFVSFYQVGLLFYVLVAALGIALVKRMRLPLALVVWLGVVLGYLAFGSVSFTRYVPLPKLPRYLEAITVPAIVLAAGVLAPYLGRVSAARPVAWTALGAYAVAGVLCAFFTSTMEQWRFAPVRAAYASLSREALTPVYASQRVANGLYQLSGTRWYVRQSLTQACGENTKLALVVWSVPAATTARPPSPGTGCAGWMPGPELQVAPSSTVSGALAVARGLVDRLPVPEFVTSKIHVTLARQEATPVVRILVADPAPSAPRAGNNSVGGERS